MGIWFISPYYPAPRLLSTLTPGESTGQWRKGEELFTKISICFPFDDSFLRKKLVKRHPYLKLSNRIVKNPGERFRPRVYFRHRGQRISLMLAANKAIFWDKLNQLRWSIICSHLQRLFWQCCVCQGCFYSFPRGFSQRFSLG